MPIQQTFSANQIVAVGVQPTVNPQANPQRLQIVAHTVGDNTGFPAGNLDSRITGTTLYRRTTSGFKTPCGFQAVKLRYSGCYCVSSPEQETPIPNPVSMQVAIEVPANSGNFKQLTFGGQLTGLLEPGLDLESDLLFLECAAGTSFSIVCTESVTTGQTMAWNAYVSSNVNGLNQAVGYAGSEVATTPFTTFTGRVNSNSNGGAMVPYSIVGIPIAQSNSVAIFCDSIVAGINSAASRNTSYFQNNYDQGWAALLFDSKIPYIKVGHGGYNAALLASSQGDRRKSMARDANFLLFSMGTNDIATYTVAQFETAFLDCFNYAQAMGMTMIAVTLPPRNNATNYLSFINGAGGQALTVTSYEANRQAVNNFIRSFSGITVLDFDKFIDPGKTGLWPVVQPAYSGTCNIAQNATGYGWMNITDAGLATAFPIANQLVAPSDGLGGYQAVFTSNGSAGSGVSGIGVPIMSNSGNSCSCAPTVSNNAYLPASTGVSYLVARPWSYDGIHPSETGHQLLAGYAHTVLGPLLGF